MTLTQLLASAMHQSYLQQGGTDPRILAQLAELELKARKSEGRKSKRAERGKRDQSQENVNVEVKRLVRRPLLLYSHQRSHNTLLWP